MAVRVEIESEKLALGKPAQVRVYDGDRLITTVIAEIEMQQGADLGLYPAVKVYEQQTL